MRRRRPTRRRVSDLLHDPADPHRPGQPDAGLRRRHGLLAGLFDGGGDVDTDLDFADFDVGADVGIGRYGQARFFAGARYVRFGESLRASVANNDPSTYYRLQTLRAERESNFTGWGPRVGFTADVALGSTGLSFGGTVAALRSSAASIRPSAAHTRTTFNGVRRRTRSRRRRPRPRRPSRSRWRPRSATRWSVKTSPHASRPDIASISTLASSTPRRAKPIWPPVPARR